MRASDKPPTESERKAYVEREDVRRLVQEAIRVFDLIKGPGIYLDCVDDPKHQADPKMLKMSQESLVRALKELKDGRAKAAQTLRKLATLISGDLSDNALLSITHEVSFQRYDDISISLVGFDDKKTAKDLLVEFQWYRFNCTKHFQEFPCDYAFYKMLIAEYRASIYNCGGVSFTDYYNWYFYSKRDHLDESGKVNAETVRNVAGMKAAYKDSEILKTEPNFIRKLFFRNYEVHPHHRPLFAELLPVTPGDKDPDE